MKKVINGVLCNTKTAKFIGNWEYSSPNDLYYCYEELYRTKSGKFFLYGEGGPASKYSRMTGSNSWSGGEDIELLSREDAREWAEEYLDSEAYIAAFGEPEEMSSVPVSEDTKTRLDELARLTGKNIDRLIAEAIERYDPGVIGE